jgi:hypothetical protein
MFLYLIVKLKGLKMEQKCYGSLGTTAQNVCYVNDAFESYQDVATSNDTGDKTSAVTVNTRLPNQTTAYVDSFILELKKAIDNSDTNLIHRKVKENPNITSHISPVFSSSANSETMLLYAISQNKIEVVKELMASGADVDAIVGGYKLTAVCQASRLKDTSILEMILKKSSLHINTSPGSNNWTPLYHAVELGNLDTVKLLVSYGADVNVYTNHSFISFYGETPLARAVSIADVNIVEYLLENQADVNKGTIGTIGKKTVVESMCFYENMFNDAKSKFNPRELKEKQYFILAALEKHGAKINKKVMHTIMGD